jgi:hypothetical protein
MEYSYENGIATFYPKPQNVREYIKGQMYDSAYKSAIPLVY